MLPDGISGSYLRRSLLSDLLDSYLHYLTMIIVNEPGGDFVTFSSSTSQCISLRHASCCYKFGELFANDAQEAILLERFSNSYDSKKRQYPYLHGGLLQISLIIALL